MSGQTQARSSRILLTGRGAVMVMLAAFALGLFGASWTPWPVLAGAFFVVGSAAAIIYVRPGDLLMVTIAPPLLFGITLLGVKAATASGNVVLSIAEGTAIAMAEGFPLRPKDVVYVDPVPLVQWNRVLDTGGTMLGNDVKITISVEANQQMAPDTMKKGG